MNLARLKTLRMIRLNTRLKNLDSEQARTTAHGFVEFIFAKFPAVSMKIERLHIVDWNEENNCDERDWKLQVAMTWNSSPNLSPLTKGFPLRSKPHNKESLGLGGTHYCWPFKADGNDIVSQAVKYSAISDLQGKVWDVGIAPFQRLLTAYLEPYFVWELWSNLKFWSPNVSQTVTHW